MSQFIWTREQILNYADEMAEAWEYEDGETHELLEQFWEYDPPQIITVNRLGDLPARPTGHSIVTTFSKGEFRAIFDGWFLERLQE